VACSVTAAQAVLSIGEISKTGSGGEDTKVPSRELHRGGVVQVQRVNAKLALSLRAVSALIASVALASHSGILVPELVHVLVIGPGQLSLRLAHTVARAGVGEARARGSLTGDAVIAVEAVALTSRTIASALVRALHVVVSGVVQLVQVSVLHLRELLGGAVRVDVVVLNNDVIGASQGTRAVQVALGSIDVSQAKLANALRAISSLPVAAANAHVVAGALSVAIAS
jgi:hypothetical protein